jgi:hypothetical protein
MADEFIRDASQQLSNVSRGILQAQLTDRQNDAIMGRDQAGGMNEGDSITERVRQAGGLRQIIDEVKENPRFDLMNQFAEESAARIETSLPRADPRNQTGPRARSVQDTLFLLGGLNENQRDLAGGQGSILQEIQRLRSSVMGQGQIDPNIGIEAGMTMLTNLLAGGAATGLSLATGIPSDAASAIVDEMQRYGVDSGMIDRIKSQIDTNKDGAVSEFETKSLLNDTAMIEKLSSMDATTRKMLRDPDFRVRVIQRKPVTSIYGEDPFARFNQVEMVEQGIANDGANANQFNVSF